MSADKVAPAVQSAPTNQQLREVLHKYSRHMGSDYYSDTEFDSLQDVIAFAREVLMLAAPIAAIVPSEPTKYAGWYCAQCGHGVDASDVTFHEQHVTCGRVISDDVSPTQAIAQTAPTLQECRHCGFMVALNQPPAKTAPAVAGEAWISVKDKLPELHSFVLVSIDERYCDTDFDVLMASYTMKRKGNGKVFTMSGGTDYHPKAITHWMPMPAAPSKGAKHNG